MWELSFLQDLVHSWDATTDHLPPPPPPAAQPNLIKSDLTWRNRPSTKPVTRDSRGRLQKILPHHVSAAVLSHPTLPQWVVGWGLGLTIVIFSWLSSFVEISIKNRQNMLLPDPLAADCRALCQMARGRGQFHENFAHLICLEETFTPCAAIYQKILN